MSIGRVALVALCALWTSFASAQTISKILYGVKPADPLALIGTAGALLAVGALAALLPARRAASCLSASRTTSMSII